MLWNVESIFFPPVNKYKCNDSHKTCRYVAAVSLYDALDSMKVLGYTRLDSGAEGLSSHTVHGSVPDGWSSVRSGEMQH